LFTKFTPVVLKPKFGQGSVGIKYFYSKQDLPSVEGVDWDNNLIQEKIISKSNVAGAFFLMYNQQLISSYCHQRLRTFPESGGVTVYSKSVDYEEIIVLGKKLLGDLRWEGVAMIEFMFDESSGKWKIIELNPRLWGSVMLSEFCNSQILKFYIELALGNQESIDFQKSYVKTNLAIRWLYPLDIISFFKGRLPAKEFLNISPATTCYVNITYSSFYRTFAYFIYFTFNISSIARFFKKIKV